MTKHLGSQVFYGSYAFRCHIGLKLFLRLACATGEGTTKFGIFLRWFDTFSDLIEFPRDVTDSLEVELSLPQNDPEWYQTFPQGLMYPRNQFLVEMDAKF